MIAAKAKTNFSPRPRKLMQAVARANFRGLGHAGAAIRLAARRSIRKRPKASLPGSPPHTRKGQLKRAIVYAVEKHQGSVVIGPDHAALGPSGGAHEFGGNFRGQRYPRRPYMGPALEAVRDRLPRFWAGSVK